MSTSYSKSTVLNNSFTSDTHNICNCLGCERLANTKILLKVGEKSITVLVCKDCEDKFKEN